MAVGPLRVGALLKALQELGLGAGSGSSQGLVQMEMWELGQSSIPFQPWEKGFWVGLG